MLLWSPTRWVREFRRRKKFWCVFDFGEPIPISIAKSISARKIFNVWVR